MAGRRSPGEGSISQRKDGRWQASLQINGQRTTVYGKTRAVAAAKLRELQRQAPARVVNLTLSKLTLNDLLDACLEMKAAKCKATTLCDYHNTCDNHLRPEMGVTRLSQISVDIIERYIAKLSSQPRTALKCYRVLSQALQLAVRWNWVCSNSCDRVDTPRYHREQRTYWTIDQTREFLHGTRDHWLYPLWTTMLFTGCRIGETLALTWADVDLDLAEIKISKTINRVRGQWVVTKPKTLTAIRRISIPPQVGVVLKALQGRGLDPHSEMMVFVGTKGCPLHATTVAHAMRRECERLGLPVVTPHGLRHIHGSLLLQKKVPIPQVTRRLGHSSPEVTMRLYAHDLAGSDQVATQAIADVLTA